MKTLGHIVMEIPNRYSEGLKKKFVATEREIAVIPIMTVQMICIAASNVMLKLKKSSKSSVLRNEALRLTRLSHRTPIGT